MKEFKIWIKSIDIITIQAETAEAALKNFEASLKTRVAPIEYGILEVDPQADTSASQ
jgi:hypothetical protein